MFDQRKLTEGRLIGFSCAGVDMFHRTGWLLFSNVAKDYQGRGIGKRFIEARLCALRQLFPHLQEVLVTANEHNAPSIRALAAHGFRLRHTEMDYYGPGKHRSILELPLAACVIPASAELREEISL